MGFKNYDKIYHEIRFDHGLNTTCSRKIFVDHRSDFGIHAHVWILEQPGDSVSQIHPGAPDGQLARFLERLVQKVKTAVNKLFCYTSVAVT